jgi:hypothetical protein
LLPGSPRIAESAVNSLFSIRAQEKIRVQPLIPRWQDIASHINPAMADWGEDSDESQPQPDFRSLYDMTGPTASSDFADGVQANSFSRIAPWLRLLMEEDRLNELHEVRLWLQAMERHCYRQLNNSPYYTEGRSLLRTGADFSNAVMFRENDIERGLPSYKNLHLKHCLLIENRWGEVDTLIRDFWLAPYEAVGQFGREALPDKVVDAYLNNKTKKWLFQQFIFPFGKFDLDIDEKSLRGMPIYSLYACQQEKKAIRAGAYERPPFWAWRYSRNPDGSAYGGDGPGYHQLSNVKQVNGMRRDISRMRQRAALPPLKATDRLQGRIRLEPNGITFLKPGEDFTAALATGNIEGAWEMVKEVQKEIRTGYHADLFLIFSANIERLKTATEAELIQAEQAAMLAAFNGRLSTEYTEPSIEDLVSIELATGRAPPPPRILRGQMIKVDLVSPLDQLQKRYLLLDNTRRFLQEVIALAEIFPEGLDNVDVNSYLRSAADIYHIDQRVLRDLADVKRIQQGRATLKAQMLQQQMANEQAQAQAKVYAASTKPAAPGSPAATRNVAIRRNPQGEMVGAQITEGGPNG